MTDFLGQAAAVRPSPRQLDWYRRGFYAFIHFGVNTFTDREWGDGSEPESLFAPAHLDCDQWAQTVRDAGMKGLILTAKHHDGFCLWPTATTAHSVKNAPGAPDVVGLAAAACQKAGIGFGVYLSPWDRNHPAYGTPAYNDVYCAQLQELLTGYGPLFCVWWDGACGEGPNGRRQSYDFPRYIELVRRYQPGAAIFYDKGPDVRWCGNEAGRARHSEWAVVPGELCPFADVQTGPGPLADAGNLEEMYNTDAEVGALANILYSQGLAFVPAEVDTSIRPGWFWHQNEEPRPLRDLFNIYLGTVGGNACLNLNLPPDRDGRLDARDVARLRELRGLLDDEFGQPLPARLLPCGGRAPSQPAWDVALPPQSKVKYVVLREDLTRGQRVESFHIETVNADGSCWPVYQGTTVGNCKICALGDPFADQNRLLDVGGESRLRVRVTAARGPVFLSKIELYG